MSEAPLTFSAQVRTELCAVEAKKQCCRRAEIAGMLFVAGKRNALQQVLLQVPAYAAPLAARLIREQFTREPKQTNENARGAVTLCFESASALKMLEHRAFDTGLLRCAECTVAALRGMFIACGSINAPDKDNYLQLMVPDFDSCLAVLELARSAEIGFFAGKRRNRNYLYLKSRQKIEDALATLGAKNAYFEFINAGIAKLARGDANRAANCITSNIEKTVRTAARQTALIRDMKKAGRLSSLPPELEETARLRLDNPSLPLERLGAAMSPPVSKSGMYHRLERICEAALDSKQSSEKAKKK